MSRKKSGAGRKNRFLKNRVRELEAQVAHLKTLAATDVLTGVGNRRALFEALLHQIAQARRELSEPLSLAMVDIDHFKQINDTHGHPAGDAVLAKLGEMLRHHIRGADSVFRFGGEEFAIIMPGTDEEGIKTFLERLRALIESEAWLVPGGAADTAAFKVTASFGAAVFRKDDTCDDLLVRADEALYEAKRTGRNRVCIAPH